MKQQQHPIMHTWRTGRTGRIAISGRSGGDVKQRQTKI